MEKYFRLEDDSLVNIIDHTLEQIQKYPNLQIYVGTDSQDMTFKHKGRKNKVSRYATTVVYRYGLRGAHYAYFLEDVPRIKDIFTRLYGEAERTLDIVKLLTTNYPIKIEGVEFDYNHVPLPKNKSNVLYSTVNGWVQGLGYKPVFKSGRMIAVKAADHIVRKKRPFKN